MENTEELPQEKEVLCECGRIQEHFIRMYAEKINDNNTIVQQHHRCLETDKRW